jgi:hypothetical protein
MFRKVALAVVAGSLVFAAQAASADDTQFDIGGGRYAGAAALPFHGTGSDFGHVGTMASAAQDRLDRTHAGVMTQSAPAPYQMQDGYFN